MFNNAIIISGSSGRLGKALIGAIDRHRYTILRMKSDNLLYSINGESVDNEALLSYSKVNFVHLASPDASGCRDDPMEALNVNFSMAHNILNQSYIHKIENFIFASTSRIYGDNLNQHAVRSGSLRIENEYAAIKYLTERMLQKIWENNKRKPNIYNLRISNIACTLNAEQTTRPLLNEFCWNAVKYDEILIKNEQNLTKNFIHIQDVCNKIQELLNRKRVPEFVALNIMSQQYFSLLDIAEKIKSYIAIKYDKEIKIRHSFKETPKVTNKNYGKITAERRGCASLRIDDVLNDQVDKYYDFLHTK